ncbi:MAG: hypothetical protein HQL74_14840 [Magnetococcales bacterium]|nr:hypothetical protein [Magnetococcales bacterium]
MSKLRNWILAHKKRTIFLSIFIYFFCSWYFNLPDLYLKTTFPLRKNTLITLVNMMQEDDLKKPKNEYCMSIAFEHRERSDEDFEVIGITRERQEEYLKHMENVGALWVVGLYCSTDRIKILMDESLGKHMYYLYSEKPFNDCNKEIFEITEGMKAYNCIQIEDKWYLFSY